jgi:hypothetical protein
MEQHDDKYILTLDFPPLFSSSNRVPNRKISCFLAMFKKIWTSIALTETCYSVKVNFAFDFLPFQDLSPLSLIRYPNFKGLRKTPKDCFIEFWRSVGCSKYHHLCILCKNIITESGQDRPMNKSHFHKSYIKHIISSHYIKRLHKYNSCFKSKNS